MRVDEAALTRWGRTVGASVPTPITLALVGPLGAGKSVLARAIGGGAGVRAPMPSPSYNLLFRYEASDGRHLVHLDLYRLEHADELWELGWESLGDRNEIVLVEWPERAAGLMPPDHWVVEIHRVDGQPSLRDVVIERIGDPPDLPSFPVHLASNEVP